MKNRTLTFLMNGTIRSLTALTVVLSLLAMTGTQTALAASFTVTKTADTADGACNADCSLREAIIAANAAPGADTITLPAGTYTLTLTGQNEDASASGDLDIGDSLTISGAGAATTIIDGNNTDAVFDTFIAPAGTMINLSNLTIQHGNPTNAGFEGGGGIYVKNTVTMSLSNVSVLNNTANTSGGGIWNEGNLTISNSIVSGNQANGVGGGIRNAGTPAASLTITNSLISNNVAELGGGIHDSTDGGVNLTITGSTITGNQAIDRPGGVAGDFGDGGGIQVNTDGGVNITNSTISGNIAARHGGGIYFFDDPSQSPVATANLNNVTITNNTANSDSDGGGDGGGIFRSSGTFNIKNTIVAGNTDNGGTNNHPDVSGAFSNQGNNLIGKNDGSSGFPTGALVGTIASPVNPQLAALSNNGGPTQTHALLSTSPAIDAGNNATCESTDQRGVARPIGAACDVGSYEAADQTPPKITLATDPSDTLAGTGWYNIASSGTDGVKVNVSATDSSGVTNITCIDNSTTTVLNTSTSSGFFILNNGLHSISCTATDGAIPANTGAGSGSTAMPASYKVDQVAPTVAMSSAASEPTGISPVTVTAQFSETVTSFGAADITASNATVGNFVAVDGDTYTFELTPAADGLVTADIAASVATDAAGNGNLAATQFSRTYQSAPTVTMTSAAPDPTSTSPIPVTAQFSRSVTGFTGSDIVAGNATVNNFVAVDGDTYTFDLTPSGQGTVTADIAANVAQDSNGNGNLAATQFSRTFDNIAPTVAMSSAAPDPTNTSPIHVTAQFSENVTGFSIGDITAGNSTVGNFVPVDGDTYTFDLTPSGQGTITGDIAAGVASDAAGNNSTAAAQFSRTYDNIAPDTTINLFPSNPSNSSSNSFAFSGTDSGSGVASFECKLDGGAFSACISPLTYSGLSDGSHTFQVRAVDSAGNVDSTPASYAWLIDASGPDTTITSNPSNPSNSNLASFTITGNDGSGVGVASFECKLDGGSFAACTSPQSYSGLSDGSHTFQVRAVDNVGNVDPTPASFTWIVDTTAPDTTIDSTPSNPSNSSNASFSFSGTDSGTGVASFQCAIDGGGFSGCTSPKTYTGLSDGSHTFQVRAIDGIGNQDPTPASFTWTIDTTAPGVAINQASAQADPTTGSPIHFTVIFNEAVTGFTGSDVTLSGTAGATTSLVTQLAPNNGTAYDVAVSGMTTDGTVIATIPANAASDAAANGNTASTSTDNSVTFIANTAPTANNDSYSTNEDTALLVPAPGVLSNDTDPDSGDTLTAVLVSGPSHGTLTLNANGSFSYTPAANYNGPDSFTYKARDSHTAESNVATVSLTVNPVNDPPTVAVAAGGMCSASSAGGTMNLTLADVDNVAGSLALTGSSSDTKVVVNANIVFGGSGASRTVTITAVPQKSSKTATVTIQVSDGQNNTTVAIKVMVGTDNNETLNGSGGADLILGLNGKNTVNGNAGNDLICGGNGVDTLSGGDGDDTLDGVNGNDVLNGGNGNDILRGNLGDDRLTGSANADFFSGGMGIDSATDFNTAQGDTQDGTIP
jgi:CSLREA domain-containing protein